MLIPFIICVLLSLSHDITKFAYTLRFPFFWGGDRILTYDDLEIVRNRENEKGRAQQTQVDSDEETDSSASASDAADKKQN